jgi:peptidoglycan-associated lipoprotein
MRPGLMLASGAACALAGTGDLGLLGFLVPRWVAATERPAPRAEVAPRAGVASLEAPPPVEATAHAEVPPPPVEVTAHPEVTVRPGVAVRAEAAPRPPPPAPAEVAQRLAAPAPAVVVRFAAESVDLDDSSARSLRGLVEQLDPRARLRVEGHADASGRDEGHQYFSRLRARTVTRKLLQLGVQPSAVSSAGFGASRPVDPGHTLEAMARNRRVEVFVDQGRR